MPLTAIPRPDIPEDFIVRIERERLGWKKKEGGREGGLSFRSGEFIFDKSTAHDV